MTESMSMRVYGILPHHARHRRGSQLPATAQAGPLAPKFLYAVDARLARPHRWPTSTRLTSLTAAAVEAGNGHVLDASHVIFPNGAITLVLILAESHLSIHTWPEEDLIAIDLFSCGGIDGDAVISGSPGRSGSRRSRCTRWPAACRTTCRTAPTRLFNRTFTSCIPNSLHHSKYSQYCYP